MIDWCFFHSYFFDLSVLRNIDDFFRSTSSGSSKRFLQKTSCKPKRWQTTRPVLRRKILMEFSSQFLSHEIHCTNCFMTMTKILIKFSGYIVTILAILFDNLCLNMKKRFSKENALVYIHIFVVIERHLPWWIFYQ